MISRWRLQIALAAAEAGGQSCAANGGFSPQGACQAGGKCKLNDLGYIYCEGVCAGLCACGFVGVYVCLRALMLMLHLHLLLMIAAGCNAGYTGLRCEIAPSGPSGAASCGQSCAGGGTAAGSV